jgi:hypothetical protein
VHNNESSNFVNLMLGDDHSLHRGFLLYYSVSLILDFSLVPTNRDESAYADNSQRSSRKTGICSRVRQITLLVPSGSLCRLAGFVCKICRAATGFRVAPRNSELRKWATHALLR